MAKELFDRPINANPALNRRIAHGTPDDTGENMTFQDLINLINGGLLKKVISLGGVDFSTATGQPWHSIAHDLDGTKIRSVKVFVRRDHDLYFTDILSIVSEIGSIVTGYASWNSTHIGFGIPEGANWVSTLGVFDDATINRGYAVVEYVP